MLLRLGLGGGATSGGGGGGARAGLRQCGLQAAAEEPTADRPVLRLPRWVGRRGHHHRVWPQLATPLWPCGCAEPTADSHRSPGAPSLSCSSAYFTPRSGICCRGELLLLMDLCMIGDLGLGWEAMTLAALICDTGQRKALKVNRHLSEGAAAGLLAGRCKPTMAYETIKKLLKLADVMPLISFEF
ncbi:unnamed protein product [Miscanthus lutarioriparius]|uniref:Uncharacterized protein n=1 Tax=Miscanthus lutarioriparius TaxID=422564 RepID=A0A811RCE8_9POAL|nr:unnamed protein product [Miscanthus lutarioriparius]